MIEASEIRSGRLWSLWDMLKFHAPYWAAVSTNLARAQSMAFTATASTTAEAARSPSTTPANATIAGQPTTPAEARPGPADKAPGTAPAAMTEDGVRVECLMNARYHSLREAFLDTSHRWLLFMVIMFGAVALIDVLPKSLVHAGAKEVFTALAAVCAAIDLTFDLSNRARVHSMMKRRYFELLADLTDGKKTLVEATACLHRYSADEEPSFHALLMLSWNAAQEMVYGSEAYQLAIPRRDRFLKQIFRFSGKQYHLVVSAKVTGLPA